jgi:2-polyprenyl-6-methoxyphenol hydroxylase-like FAD-dependent oxidoreductase
MGEPRQDGVLIIGGGIGGLAAGIALHRAGIPVQVFEQRAAAGELGAGLTLWANAMHALARLGLDDTVRARGRAGIGGTIRTAQGAPLQRITPADLERAFGSANVAIHRADLQALLMATLPAGMLHRGMRLTGVEQDSAGVRACFADGQEVRGAVLIGADGIRSTVRAGLWGDTPPRYAGYTAWRGVARIARDPPPGAEAGFEAWGCGARLGAVAIGGRRIYWFATRNAPEGETDSPRGRKADLLDLLAGWHPTMRALVAATDAVAILRHDIYDRPPRAPWGQGRVTLLGDAAHAMTPNLGQGACQAIEDAVVLADALRAATDPVAGLRAYEAARAPRTAQIVRQSWLMGRVAQWEQPGLCRVRAAAMRAMPERLVLAQLAPILGYRV